MFPKRRITMGGDVFRDERSLRFDGVDERVDTGFIPNYIHTNATMAMWIKMYDFTDNQLSGHHGDKRWYMGFVDTAAGIGVQGQNNLSTPITITPTPVVGEWIHYAVTAIDATATVYINGVAQGTLSYTQASAQNPDEGLWCGATNNNGSIYKPMNASISEVVQYNIGLTASEIKTLYNGREPYNHNEGIAVANLKNWLRMGDGALDHFDASGDALLNRGLITDETDIGIGLELISDGNFGLPEENPWTLGSGWSIGSGVATRASGESSNSSIAYSGDVISAGNVYKYSFDYNVTAGNFSAYLGGETIDNAFNASGTTTGYVTSSSGAEFTVYGLTSAEGTIDNVSVKLVSGNPGTMVNMAANDFEGDTP